MTAPTPSSPSGQSAAGTDRPASQPGEVLLRMTGVVKQFSSVRALDGVDLDVRAGEVHCLLGQNGAGKSTLMKVLSAAYQPDEGTIWWDGEEVRLSTPQAAIKAGISTIYQELDLVPGLSVTENIFLGHEVATAGLIRRKQAQRMAQQLLERLGHGEIPASRLVAELSPAGQQIVSMARALSHSTRLLILDEPSAVLDHGEVDNLFRVIRGLTAEGVAVVYISHRLEEIRRIGDRITVLKDGSTVATGLPALDTPTSELIRLMTGRSIEYVFPPRKPPPVDEQPVVLEVQGLALAGVFSGVDLTVHAGEVVGLAGLVGSGRTEILETLYGARRASAGTVRVDGRQLRRGSVTQAVRSGVGLAPEERKSQGLLLDETVYRNITVSSLHEFSKLGFLASRDERRRAAELTRSLDVRPADVDRVVRTMSGGNQQKVVLARWLLRGCRVLLLDEPTRGVDVGARSEIYRLIAGLADSGVAVVVVSSEVEEVLGLADRVLVVREGRVVHEAAAADIDESQVLDLVMEGAPA
ncbi:sugar ABC transporter ATP-binding protein [Nocardioides ochotonae]|uniref:sugar ABC transporter ATP-binding protein n=1 Tax=Nocardioides ochotonae TaxID=2685869 RepID=UPI0014084124|nr:sugar ABC transporter ATP-binding protein [Nocardioides ochotonae]